MSYKKAIELSPPHFKRLYGVSQQTFWKMEEVVQNAKQGSRGSHAKLSIPDQILLTSAVLAGVQNLFSHS
jgi:hypothetical protein